MRASGAQHGVAAIDARWIEKTLRLQQQRAHPEVIARCEAALACEPDHTDVLNLLAAAFLAQGRMQDGIRQLRRATELAPTAKAHSHLGGILATAGDFEGAITNYRTALALEPDAAARWNTLATLLKALARYDEAEECCDAGLRAEPRHAALNHLLATVMFEQGRVEDAIAKLRAALALRPDYPSAHSDLLRMLNYADAQDPLAIWREHRAWGERHAAALERAAPLPANAPDPARRLRIGYVSPYFRKHAVTFFLEAVLEHRDQTRFDVILYADVARPDDFSQRLQALATGWRDTVGMSDAELAQLIRDDAIDILVDLSGHTPGNRLLAFARKPAPVQVTWNGYPNTTGMDSMGYRITDVYCDPPGATENLHSEKLVRLPGIYMAWRPPFDAPDATPLPALTAKRVTFGSFNSCYKLTPQLIALWSRILARVPQSRLLLLTIGAGVAERRILELFAHNGIEAQRLDVRPRVTHEEFLTLHNEADIALDAFPYHGTTTTCFSLWMGLPVVTLAGATHASRVGVSILSNAGLPQMIATTGDEYVDIAVDIARDLPRLAEMRANLRGNLARSPIADGRTCARNLEQAFHEMWIAWCGRR
jgi:protein O-GlcNAc transferase